MSTQCPHGQLARQCLNCEQAAEIERLTQRNNELRTANGFAELEAEIERLRAVIRMAAKDHWPHGTRAQINAAAKEECDGA